MPTRSILQPIVVYLVDRHPLEVPGTGPLFRWLHLNNDYKGQLDGLIGPFDHDQLTVLVDDMPAGEAWHLLLENLLEGGVRIVVTHLAPLSSAQRQQLIGVCAQVGTRLITPGDAGRNRLENPVG
jgi:hypothetical protein